MSVCQIDKNTPEVIQDDQEVILYDQEVIQDQDCNITVRRLNFNSCSESCKMQWNVINMDRKHLDHIVLWVETVIVWGGQPLLTCISVDGWDEVVKWRNDDENKYIV